MEALASLTLFNYISFVLAIVAMIQWQHNQQHARASEQRRMFMVYAQEFIKELKDGGQTVSILPVYDGKWKIPGQKPIIGMRVSWTPTVKGEDDFTLTEEQLYGGIKVGPKMVDFTVPMPKGILDKLTLSTPKRYTSEQLTVILCQKDLGEVDQNKSRELQ